MKMNVLHDLRPWFGPSRDQGPRPTCLIFAASDAHAAIRTPWSELSCEYLFYHAQRRAGRPPNVGATLDGVLASLREDGQPREEKWPYLPTTPANSATWRPPADVEPIFRCRCSQSDSVVDNIIQHLGAGKPALVLLKLTQAFYCPPATAILDADPSGTLQSEQRHAVVALGVGRIAHQRYILVRNSWGHAWGDGGHVWLGERYLAAQVFAVCLITETVDVPTNTIAA